MVTEGMKNVTAGANPMDIRRGMSKAVTKAVETIKAHSQKVKDSNDIARVGTISAGDPEIGRLIAEAKLHTFYDLVVGLGGGLVLLDGDDTVGGDLLHGLGDQAAAVRRCCRISLP